jgi:hypothetical protein
MNKKTIHIKSPISRDDLDAVITGLEVACGGIRIEISEAFDLVVTNERQAAALEALFGGNESSLVEEGQKVKKIKQIQRKYPTEKKELKIERKCIYYTFLTGERENQQITGGALGGMLKAGKIEPGTRLSHPINGEYIVIEDGLGKYSLCVASDRQAVPA